MRERPETVRADLALPNDEDTPAGVPQLALMQLVSLLCPLQFGLPIVRVALRDAAVSASSVLVPETAVDEDRCEVAFEHDIGSPRQDVNILSEPEPLAMEIRSNPSLR